MNKYKNFLITNRHSIILIFILFASGLFISFYAFNLTQAVGREGIAALADFIPSDATATPSDLTPQPTLDTNPIYLPTAVPWDGNERITILLLGLDYRDWEEEEPAYRSDTMILVSMDPVTLDVGILSIPRDLWVNIPGFGPAKINTAYYKGDIYKLPGGGPGLAMKTVEEFIGIPIDYYAQVDFASFVKFIDLISGVKMDIPSPITVDPIGPKPPVNIPSGIHVLDGELALAYARARHTEGGDFARAGRQQQVIIGIRDRLVLPEIFSMLIANAPQIYAELSSGISTNLSLEDAIKLAYLAIQVEIDDIKMGVIDEKSILFGESPDKLAILIPLTDKIRELRDELFPSGGAVAPHLEGSLEDNMQTEAANIILYNGTDDIDIEVRTSEYFNSFGTLSTSSNATVEYQYQGLIIDHTGNPYMIEWLVSIPGLNNARILVEYDPNATYDLELYLGSVWLYNNPMP